MRGKKTIKQTQCKIRKNGILVPGMIVFNLISESTNPNNIMIKIQDSGGQVLEAFLDISGLVSMRQNIEELHKESNSLIYQQGRY